MKTINRLLLILLFCFLFFYRSSYGQDNLQNIFQPVFNNPAYNAFKNCVSIEAIARRQWGSNVEGSPNVYGVNVFIPIEKKLGGAVMAFNEELGLNTRVIVTGSLSHYIRISHKGYLGFGYSAGIEQNSYNISKIYEDNPGLIVGEYDLEDQVNARIAIGLFYYRPYFFSGISVNTALASEYSEYQVARGFDWIIGGMFMIQDWLFLKPEFSIKYDRVRDRIYSGSIENKGWVDPIYNMGLNTLLFDRIYLGISHRFKFAQTYSFGLYINRSVKLQYSFERGVGSGINQFDSHVFGFTWNICKKKKHLQSNTDPGTTFGFNPVLNNLIYK